MVLHFPRYDVELFQRIEALIGKKLPAFPTQEEEVMMLVERVSEAQRFARIVSVCFEHSEDGLFFVLDYISVNEFNVWRFTLKFLITCL